MSKTPESAELYQKAFLQLIAEDKNISFHAERGREFLYRPGQLLVSVEDQQRVIEKLRENNIVARPGEGFAGMARITLPNNAEEIPRIVRLLRDQRNWPNQRVPLVQPHHVIVGHGGLVMGNPGDRPYPTDPISAPKMDDRLRDVRVGIIDTGISQGADSDHSDWFAERYAKEADDVDPAFSNGDVFALQGGHGTFVAGVIQGAAPGVTFDPEIALDANGFGDEERLCRKITELGRKKINVLNLSLGCFTEDDVASEPLRRTIAALPDDIVVVASAGNSGTQRPSWPAALCGVTAVAAAEQTKDGAIVPAWYSNWGHWVDACAIGNRASTYLKGEWKLPGEASTPFALWAYWYGTSFAAPMVTGRIAATMASDGITAAQARDKLLSEPEFAPGYGVFVK
ncbi:peptidase S8/S53 subtilisin kexin sedolisin [Lentzea aerocolonigenes]|uniref:Peptidase S8/S53 subtilisin kexin sedolisin n=1 Tax=Lentzea aerocolonigenes TaxID=68170 RepID=A0A0F0GCN2_LENAE|nr:peptidase S8/S53 subtilisin kexin sedolisin [Lentzea aerocolonigenes]